MKSFIIKHKKLCIILLSVIVLIAAGFIAFKVIVNNMGKAPELTQADENFEYETLNSLLKEYALSEEDMNKSVNDFGEDEGFTVYRRAFIKLMTNPNYYVYTDGDLDSAGIAVKINNVRKFDGTNYYMRMTSKGSSSTFSAASDNDTIIKLLVTDNNKNNLATIINVKDNNKKTVFYERDYVFNYGGIPYVIANYVIKDSTIQSAKFTPAENGLFKIELVLDPAPATVGMIKQMKALSGTDANYAGGKLIYSVYVDSNFAVKKGVIDEAYKVKALGIDMDAKSVTTDYYYYPGEGGYIGLSADEMFDLSDVPSGYNPEEAAKVKDVSNDAVAELKGKGINADINVKIGETEITGRLQGSFSDSDILRLDAKYLGKDVSLYLALNADKSINLLIDVNGVKVSLILDTPKDLVNEILGIIKSFGVELELPEGLDIGDIVESLSLDMFVDDLANIDGVEQENGDFVFDAKMLMGLIPAKMTVSGGKVTSLVIDGIAGADVKITLTPSEKEFDLEEITEFNEGVDLTALLKNRKISLNLSANIKGVEISGSVKADLSNLEDVKAIAELTVEGVSAKLYVENINLTDLKIEDIKAYVSVGTVNIAVDVKTVMEYVSIFVDTGSIDLSNLLGSIDTAFKGFSIGDKEIDLDLTDLIIKIKDKLDVDLFIGNDVSLSVSDLTFNASVVKPDVTYTEIKDIGTLLLRIKDQLNQSCFTFNGQVNIGKAVIAFKDIKIKNTGDLSDPTTAFNEGKLTITGTLNITADGKTHKLVINYVNNTLYISYNDALKVKLSRASLDDILDLILSEYDNVLERFNYSKIFSEETMEKLKGFELNFKNIIDIIGGLTVKENSVSINVNGSKLGLNNVISIGGQIDGNGNLQVVVSFDDITGTLTLNNNVFDTPTVPSGTYMDFSGVSHLLKAAVKAIEKESGVYYLSGTMNATTDILNIGLKDVKVSASVRLVDKEDGGKDVEAVIDFDNTTLGASTLTVNSLIHSFIEYGKSQIIIKGGNVYMSRTEYEPKAFGQIEKKGTSRRCMTLEYSTKTVLDQIGFFLGFNPEQFSDFSGGATDVKVENLISGYSGSATSQQINLRGSALVGSDMIGTIKTTIGIDKDYQLNSLKVDVPISVSILKMDATVNLKHDVSSMGNFTAVDSLNPALYGTLLK